MVQNLADAKKGTILERFEYRATPVEVLFIFIPSPVKDRPTRKAKSLEALKICSNLIPNGT